VRVHGESVLAAFAIAAAVTATLVAAQAPVHPLEQARAGQWVLHRSVVQQGETPADNLIYKWIDSVHGREVHLKIQPVMEGGRFALAAPTLTIVNLDKPPDREGAPSAATEEDLVFKGRKLRCRRVETVTDDPLRGRVMTTRWSSSEVPIYGTVKSITLDKDQREVSRIDLVDFGESGGAERPYPPIAPEDRLGPMKRD
jgi:hypothetical protein